MVTIDGLTTKQVEMLDTMWNIDSAEDYTEWKETLNSTDRKMVILLEEMIVLAELDNLQDEECDRARDYLSMIAEASK